MRPLTEQEQIIYLANTLFVANSDATLSPKELAAIEEIRTIIGAKKNALTIARKTVESGNCTISTCGDFATQINNLSDLLYICYVDGDLSEKEKVLVNKYSKSIGITQDQFNTIQREALERVNSLSLKITCPKCSAESDSKIKFCPNCGMALSNIPDESIKTAFEIPKTGLAIEFSESTAAGFQKALEYAKQASKYDSCERSKKNWYLAHYPENSFESATQLAGLLSGIRNKRIYENGVEVDWGTVFSFVWCAERRKEAYKPVEYCFGKDENRINPWGCRQINLEWTDWAQWFSYGGFKKIGMLKNKYVWVFDKERIRHEVLTNMHKIRRCPYLRSSLIEAVIKALPDQVEVSPTVGWRYNRGYQEVPGSIKIVEIEKSNDFEIKNEYFSDGVRPLGFIALRQVLSSAFAEATVNDITIDTLTK